jgi:hypothetical protein
MTLHASTVSGTSDTACQYNVRYKWHCMPVQCQVQMTLHASTIPGTSDTACQYNIRYKWHCMPVQCQVQTRSEETSWRRHRHKLEGNIKTDLKNPVSSDGVTWLLLQTFVSYQVGEIIGPMSHYQLLMNVSSVALIGLVLNSSMFVYKTVPHFFLWHLATWRCLSPHCISAFVRHVNLTHTLWLKQAGIITIYMTAEPISVAMRSEA